MTEDTRARAIGLAGFITTSRIGHKTERLYQSLLSDDENEVYKAVDDLASQLAAAHHAALLLKALYRK